MKRLGLSVATKTMVLSLCLSAMACGLPGIGGGLSDRSSAVTETPPPSPSVTPLRPTEPTAADSPSSTSACSNAFFPVAQGATWSYDVTGGPNGTTSYVDTISVTGGDSFTLTTAFGDTTRTQRWSCTSNGLVALDFGGASATLAVADLHAVFDTAESSGVTLPAHISPGDTWSQTFTLEGTLAITGDQTTKASGQVRYDSTATGMESVRVPAGTFDALRIDGISSMEIGVEMGGFTVPMTISGTFVRWYAPGVGFVRSVEDSDVFDTQVKITTELTGYSIP
jgi:hypothetical protein